MTSKEHRNKFSKLDENTINRKKGSKLLKKTKRFCSKSDCQYSYIHLYAIVKLSTIWISVAKLDNLHQINPSISDFRTNISAWDSWSWNKFLGRRVNYRQGCMFNSNVHLNKNYITLSIRECELTDLYSLKLSVIAMDEPCLWCTCSARREWEHPIFGLYVKRN